MAAQALVITPAATRDSVAAALAPSRFPASHALPPPPSDVGSCDSDLESYQSAEENLAGGGPDVADPVGMLPAMGPHPCSPAAARPTREAIAACPDYPVMITADELPGVSVAHGPGALPVNSGRPISFESSLFRGQACVFIRGLKSTPPALFKGQKRKTLLVVQGQFLEDVGFDDLVTGQEFDRARNLPPAWLLDNVLLKVARSISPSMQVGPAAAPFMLMPVVAGCNQIHVAAPGRQPAMAQAPEEDMRLVDARLAARDGSPLSFASRRAFFSDPANRQGRRFDPGLVWTFYFYQHLVDISAYTLNMVYRFHLPYYLDGQPLQLMVKDRRRGRYLFRFHMWHEQLLQDAAAAAHRAAQRS